MFSFTLAIAVITFLGGAATATLPMFGNEHRKVDPRGAAARVTRIARGLLHLGLRCGQAPGRTPRLPSATGKRTDRPVRLPLFRQPDSISFRAASPLILRMGTAHYALILARIPSTGSDSLCQ